MKKKAIIKSFIFVLVIFIFMISISFAWFAYYEGLDGAILPIGDIDYDYSGSFIDENEIIYPGKNLLDQAISVENQSNIDTQLRVKIEYTLIEETNSTKVYKDDVDDDLEVVFDSAYILNGDYWYFGDTDFDIITNGNKGVVSYIAYDGFNSSIEYEGQTINVEILIQIKQSEYVEWTDLVNYDFTTGEEITT
jgi:hypothetical protein